MTPHDLQSLLSVHLMRLDCIETRTHLARGKGLYIAPESSEAIALNVALELATVALDGKWRRG